MILDPIILSGPHVGHREIECAAEAAGTGWNSRASDFVLRLQQQLAAYARQRHAIAVSNGRALVKADKLDIEVTGGARSGNSASYGVLSSTGISGEYNGYSPETKTDVTLQSNNLNIRVEDRVKAVGVSADGRNSSVRIMGTDEAYDRRADIDPWQPLPEPTQDKAVSVVITATVTGPGALGGIAVEAINGGMVSFNGSTVNDSIVLNGSVVIGTEMSRNEDGYYNSAETSFVHMNTGAGDDRILLNGDVQFHKAGYFTVDTGEGNDIFQVEGAVKLGKGGQFRVDTGDGDDSVIFNGGIVENDENGYVSINTGTGNDLVSISGGVHGGYVDILAGEGDDRIFINGGITRTENGGHVHIDAGEGNDLVAINGKIGTDSLYVDGGSGYDVLVLQAPDAATFEQWYGDWFTSGGLNNVQNCESIVFYGLDPDNLPQSVTDAITNHGNLNFQVYTGDADYGILQSLGGDGHDMLYVRSDAGLSTLGDGSNINRVDSILLDMADGEQQSLNLDGLLGKVYDQNADTDIYLKMDSNDTLAGWNRTEDTATFKGEQYNVYTSNDSDGQEMQLYVKLMTDI